MGAPLGNKNAVGNSGGGAHTVKESIWHKAVWENIADVEALEQKIASKHYAPRDVYLLKVLKADTVILKNLADKVLADLHEMRSLVDVRVDASTASSDAIRERYESELRNELNAPRTNQPPSLAPSEPDKD